MLYLPCVFLLWGPYSTVARRTCISCCETEEKAEQMMDRLLTVKWGMRPASYWNFLNPCLNAIMLVRRGIHIEAQRQERKRGMTRERGKGKRRSTWYIMWHASAHFFDFFTWWLTHVYYHMRMTKPIISPFVYKGLWPEMAPEKPLVVAFAVASFEENLRTHATHEAEAKEMPTAPVTVYNPTLTVSHTQRCESTLALCIHVWQEVVKLLVERFMNKEVPLIIMCTCCKQWKVKCQVVRLLFIPV